MVNEKELKKGYFTILVVGLAMVASVFIYAVLVELIASQYSPFNGFVEGFEHTVIMRYVFIGTSVVTLAIIGPIRRAVLSDKYARLMAQKPGASAAEQPFHGQFMSATTIVLALCEVPAIFGLTLFLLAGNRIDFYIFMAVSIVGFVVFFPRYSQLKAWAANKEGGATAGEETKRRTEYDRHTGRYKR